MIGRFRSILFVSVFQGSLSDAIIVIDGTVAKNPIVSWALNFRVRMLLKTAIMTCIKGGLSQILTDFLTAKNLYLWHRKPKTNGPFLLTIVILEH